jgi:hypothetical protein
VVRTRKGTRSYRKKSSRAASKQKTRVALRKRKTRVRKQKGGNAHIPEDRFPEESIVSVRDANDKDSPFFVTSLKEAEKELIAASDRPQDPYDTDAPGDEPVPIENSPTTATAPPSLPPPPEV